MVGIDLPGQNRPGSDRAGDPVKIRLATPRILNEILPQTPQRWVSVMNGLSSTVC